MSGLVKLHYGIAPDGGGRLWAYFVEKLVLDRRAVG
jgi:hypothetical protein